MLKSVFLIDRKTEKETSPSLSGGSSVKTVFIIDENLYW